MKLCRVIVLTVAVCLLLCGCDMWMDGSYHSVTPHQEADSVLKDGTVEVSEYSQLYHAVCDMVADGIPNGVIYTSTISDKQLKTYLNLVRSSVMTSDPIGAYAVNSVDWEVGTNAGRTAVALTISYSHSRADILRIKHVASMDAVYEQIHQALISCEPNVAIMVEKYEAVDFVQKVQDFVEQNPQLCMEMPQVSPAVYPRGGDRRVVELVFGYQNSREDLRQMQDYVQPIFRAANLNVSAEEEETTKFSRMYAFLMERTDYQQETSLTPAYSLLRHGVGDSKAFAMVYSAMCREAGLTCMVVTGSRDGEPWSWNLICADGVYYHVDLLRSLSSGKLLRMTDAEMRGYVWDYDAFPAASPVQQEQPAEDTVPDETVEEETLPPETVAPEGE